MPCTAPDNTPNEQPDSFAEERLYPGVVITPDSVSIPVFHYRENALREGSLVDVSDTARQAGFTAPVAVTAALWKDIASIPEVYRHEDKDGRLWDVVSMAYFAVKNARIDGPELRYNLILHVEDRSDYTVRLIAQPGDSGELVITLSNPAADKEVELGEIVLTPGALDAFVEAKASPGPYIARHQRGDWGELEEDDRKANDKALAEGDRILSAYTLPETSERIWIVTEWDRGYTTVLLPSEY